MDSYIGAAASRTPHVLGTPCDAGCAISCLLAGALIQARRGSWSASFDATLATPHAFLCDNEIENLMHLRVKITRSLTVRGKPIPRRVPDRNNRTRKTIQQRERPFQRAKDAPHLRCSD